MWKSQSLTIHRRFFVPKSSRIKWSIVELDHSNRCNVLNGVFFSLAGLLEANTCKSDSVYVSRQRQPYRIQPAIQGIQRCRRTANLCSFAANNERPQKKADSWCCICFLFWFGPCIYTMYIIYTSIFCMCVCVCIREKLSVLCVFVQCFQYESWICLLPVVQYSHGCMLFIRSHSHPFPSHHSIIATVAVVALPSLTRKILCNRESWY